MWDRITDIAKTVAAMLSNSKVPPNTPPKYVSELRETNFLRSKKFFVVFTSAVMILLFYAVSVFILFLTAPIPTLTTPFVTIFVETLKIFAIIISAYLGLQAAIDFKYNSTSNTEFKSEEIITTEIVDSALIEIFAAKYADDKSYAPLSWVEEQAYE